MQRETDRMHGQRVRSGLPANLTHGMGCFGAAGVPLFRVYQVLTQWLIISHMILPKASIPRSGCQATLHHAGEARCRSCALMMKNIEERVLHCERSVSRLARQGLPSSQLSSLTHARHSDKCMNGSHYRPPSRADGQKSAAIVLVVQRCWQH